MRPFYAVLLGLAFLSAPAHAQVTPTVGPGGGEVWDLVRTSDGTVYAGMARGGVFRSTDGGLTWASFRNGMVRFGVRDLSFGPDGTLYAAGVRYGDSFDGSPAAYRLAPGATVWTDITGNLGSGGVSILALPDGTLLVGTYYRLYRSADGGTTWTEVPGTQSKPFWTLLRATDGTVYATTRSPETVLRSDDGGLTWAATGGGIACGECGGAPLIETPDGAVLFAPGQYYYTTDRGATWQMAAHPFPGSAGGFSLSPDGTVHASDLSGYVRSTDNGRSWTTYGHNSAGIYHHPRAIVRADDGRMLVGTRDHGVVRSDAAIYLWQPSNTGLAAAQIYDLAVGPDGRLYAAAGDEAFRSADGSQSWEPLGARVSYAYSVAATADAVYVGALNGTVVRLRDDGTRASLRVGTGTVGDVYGIVPLPSGRIVAHLQDDVYVSDDAAATWTRTFDGSAGYDDAFVRGADGRLYTGHSGGLLRSTDDGQTWALVTADFGTGQTVEVNEIGVGGGRLYAARRNIVFRSADDGATWASTQVPPFDNAVEVLHVADDGALWVGARYGLFRSDDGGATFEDRSAGLYDPSVTDILPLGAARGGSGGVLVATQGGGLVAVSADGTAAEPASTAGAALRLGAYPNPSAGPLTISATLAAPADVRLVVGDALGRRVAVLHDGPLAAGPHALPFDASALPAGVYAVRVEAGPVAATRTFTVVR